MLRNACSMQANECDMHVVGLASTDERGAETSTALTPPPRGNGIPEININTFPISRNWITHGNVWAGMRIFKPLIDRLTAGITYGRSGCCKRTGLFSQGQSCRWHAGKSGFVRGLSHLPCEREQVAKLLSRLGSTMIFTSTASTCQKQQPAANRPRPRHRTTLGPDRLIMMFSNQHIVACWVVSKMVVLEVSSISWLARLHAHCLPQALVSRMWIRSRSCDGSYYYAFRVRTPGSVKFVTSMYSF
jgi:hypothetical protein